MWSRFTRMALRSRILVGLVAGVMVFGAVFAVAASLGVTSSTLGAGGSSVTSCDTDGVTAGYGDAYDSTLPGYKVTTVTITGINGTNCNGKTIKVTLTGSGNAALAERTDTLDSTSSKALDFSTGAGAPVSASSVTGIQAVING
jgi:hypothetical protein